MDFADAQREVRTVYLGGAIGSIVSGTIWLISAAIGTWSRPAWAIAALVIGGTFIFPITTLVLKLMKRPASLGSENPMGLLAMQTAFVIPFCYPVVAAATLHNLNWFYPAFMVVVGAHYLPFVSLYGIWLYSPLAAVMVIAGYGTALNYPHTFAAGGWITGIGLLLYAPFLGRFARAQDRSGVRVS